MMTLDKFKNEIENAAKEMKSKLQATLVKGIEAKLDEDVMVFLVQNTIKNVMENDNTPG